MLIEYGITKNSILIRIGFNFEQVMRLRILRVLLKLKRMLGIRESIGL